MDENGGDVPAACARGTGPGRSLFGPSSITWRVHSDPLTGLASMRALLLQSLHPVTMDAFDQHSDLPNDPWRRLTRVTEFLATVTFGSASEAMTAASRLRAVHARIAGRTSTGEQYSADDPQLLAWVHCCFVASLLEIVTRGGTRLTGLEQDAYVAEQARAAMLVGLEPEEVPHDRSGLVDYFRVIRPALTCTESARRTALAVVSEPPVHEVPRRAGSGAAPAHPAGDGAVPPAAHDGRTPPSPRPVWASVAGLAFAALPPWARRLYALPRTPGVAALDDASATAALRALRVGLGGEILADRPARPKPPVGDVTGRDGRPARP